MIATRGAVLHDERVDPDARLGGGVAGAQAQVLDVIDGFIEQRGNVVVVETVNDVAAVAVSAHQAEVAQQPKLV